MRYTACKNHIKYDSFRLLASFPDKVNLTLRVGAQAIPFFYTVYANNNPLIRILRAAFVSLS